MVVEQGRVIFQPDRVREEHGNTYFERQGVKFLTVDLTPASLRMVGKFEKNPLYITVAEILPRTHAGLIPPEPEWKKVVNGVNYGGLFLSAGMHKDEGTSYAMAIELRGNMAVMTERPSLMVVALEFGSCVERLREHLLKSGKDVSEIDINRKFISPYEKPKDEFEELAQGYLKFIIHRYYLQKLVYIDAHSDPLENDLRQYLIIDRTRPKNLPTDQTYDWAVSNFADISVVYDLRSKLYEKETLYRSLAAQLMAFGVPYVATLECAAGTSVNDLQKYRTQRAIVSAMLKMNLIAESEGVSLFDKLTGRIQSYGESKPLYTVNKLLKAKKIRREWMKFYIPHSGSLQFFPELFNRVLSKTDIIGLLSGASYPVEQTFLRGNRNNFVLLGLPNIGIVNRNLDKSVLVSVAVPEK